MAAPIVTPKNPTQRQRLTSAVNTGNYFSGGGNSRLPQAFAAVMNRKYGNTAAPIPSRKASSKRKKLQG